MEIRLPKNLMLLQEFIGNFPGVGSRSAQKILVHLLKLPAGELQKFAGLLSGIDGTIRYCGQCHFFLSDSLCPFCHNDSRDKSLLCVVEQFSDILGIEKTGNYQGLYHILGGVIAPLRGIGIEKLHLNTLTERTRHGTKEVILALNPETEGEVTMHFLTGLLKKESSDLIVSRLAFGLPVGANLEYCDTRTLSEALNNRKTI
ncbi:MAG: recombination mediator RecR [Candidatus Wallbacteria bacterium]|nr:recombination mediator RecR [Candidatus Wallbacteria bacterium]